MGLFDQFPYTNFHELNLDWLLKLIKELNNKVENFVSLNTIKYADPIQWNITTQYEANTVVVDPQTGVAYISSKPVPAGVSISDTGYWSVIFDLKRFVTQAAKNFTSRYEEETTLTATFSTPSGGWLVWGDTLYEALVNITAGDSYVINSNIRHITMEEVINNINTAIANEASSRASADYAITQSLNNEISNRETAVTNLQNAIAAETTARENADNALTASVNNLDITKRYFLFVSDSYNGHPDVGTWGGSTARYLGLSSDHYYYFGVSGADFTNGGMLTSANNCMQYSTVDLDEVTDIVIGCGANELLDYTSDSVITAAIDSVYTALKNGCPNVKRLYLAFIGNDRQRVTADNINDDLEMRIINDYRYCEKYDDFKFIPNVEYVLKNYAYLANSDLLHPTTEGYDKIGLATAKYLMGLDNSIDEYQPLSGSWVNASGITNITDRRCHISRHNQMTVINFDLLHCSCSWNASNGNPLTIKTMPLGLVMPTAVGGETVLGQCAMELYDGTNWHDVDCSIGLVINSSTAPFRALLVIKYNSDNALSGVTQFKIYNKKIVVPTTIC